MVFLGAHCSMLAMGVSYCQVMLTHASYVTLESILLDCYTCAYVEPTCSLLVHPKSKLLMFQFVAHILALLGQSRLLGCFAIETIPH